LIGIHARREKAIKKCLNEAAENVQTLQNQKASEPDNENISKQLRKGQSMVCSHISLITYM